jgi:hypothetical protein
VIDPEFWQRCNPHMLPERSACLSGVSPNDLQAPRAEWVRDPYRKRWIPFTCLTLRSFLNDPAWVQVLKRPWVYLWLLPGALAFILKGRCSRLAQRVKAASQSLWAAHLCIVTALMIARECSIASACM